MTTDVAVAASETPPVTVTVKLPVSLVVSPVTVRVGVCEPWTTLVSPGLPVTGAPSTSGVLLKAHWKLSGPVPDAALFKVSEPPMAPNTGVVGLVVKAGGVGVVMSICAAEQSLCKKQARYHKKIPGDKTLGLC